MPPQLLEVYASQLYKVLLLENPKNQEKNETKIIIVTIMKSKLSIKLPPNLDRRHLTERYVYPNLSRSNWVWKNTITFTYGIVVSSTISALTPNETRFWNLAIKPSRSYHPSLSQNTETIDANLPAFSCKA